MKQKRNLKDEIDLRNNFQNTSQHYSRQLVLQPECSKTGWTFVLPALPNLNMLGCKTCKTHRAISTVLLGKNSNDSLALIVILQRRLLIAAGNFKK